MHAYDIQTDRIVIARPRLHSMHRGKMKLNTGTCQVGLRVNCQKTKATAAVT